jgi:hypothetical protein
MRWLPLLALTACSDPSTAMPDAAAAMADAYDSARCLIKGDFGAVGSVSGVPTTMSGNSLSATIDPGPPRDTFFVKLTAGRGVFAGGIAPGTYTISGVDAGYLTCGLCVHIIADITTNGPSKFYFADSGSVTLTTTNPIAGSATNLHLTAVDINSGMKIADGCDAKIASIMFTTM